MVAHITLEMTLVSSQQAPGKRSPAGRARRLQNPFPGVIARAIINAVHGFSSLSRTKAGGSVPDPDRSPGIEPRSPRDGFNGDKRHPLRDADHGVEPCSSGVHVDAGHHPALAVGNRRQGGSTGRLSHNPAFCVIDGIGASPLTRRSTPSRWAPCSSPAAEASLGN